MMRFIWPRPWFLPSGSAKTRCSARGTMRWIVSRSAKAYRPCVRDDVRALVVVLDAGAGDQHRERGDDQRGGQRPEDGRVGAQADQQQGGADRTDRAGAVGPQRDGAADRAVVTRAEDLGQRG